VFRLEAVKDAEGKVIQEAPLPVWANFQQRALGIIKRPVWVCSSPSTKQTAVITFVII